MVVLVVIVGPDTTRIDVVVSAVAPGGPAARDGPAAIEHDRRQPGSQPQRGDPRPVVRGERSICPDKRILCRLLGVTGVTEHPQRDRVEPVLMGEDQRIERAVHVVGELGDKAVVGVHHHEEPPSREIRCTRPRYASGGAGTIGIERSACDNRADGP